MLIYLCFRTTHPFKTQMIDLMKTCLRNKETAVGMIFIRKNRNKCFGKLKLTFKLY